MLDLRPRMHKNRRHLDFNESRRVALLARAQARLRDVDPEVSSTVTGKSLPAGRGVRICLRAATASHVKLGLASLASICVPLRGEVFARLNVKRRSNDLLHFIHLAREVERYADASTVSDIFIDLRNGLVRRLAVARMQLINKSINGFGPTSDYGAQARAGKFGLQQATSRARRCLPKVELPLVLTYEVVNDSHTYPLDVAVVHEESTVRASKLHKSKRAKSRGFMSHVGITSALLSHPDAGPHRESSHAPSSVQHWPELSEEGRLIRAPLLHRARLHISKGNYSAGSSLY